MAGIASYGAYIPFHRLKRAECARAWGTAARPGEKAVANYDEDSITMATAAAIDCLGGIDTKTVDGIYFATTTPPYIEKLGAAVIAAALDLRRDIQSMDITGTLRAGTTAISAALNAVDAGAARNILVVSADCRLGAMGSEFEQGFGDGAAALLVSRENMIAEICGSYTICDEFSGIWRLYGDTFVRSWEDRMILDKGYSCQLPEAISGICDKYGIKMNSVKKVVYDAPTDPRRHKQIARRFKLEPEQVQDPMDATVGCTGAAMASMMMAAALEQAGAGDEIIFASYGNGADAFWCKATPDINNLGYRRGVAGHLSSKRDIRNYETYLRWKNLVSVETVRRPERDPVSLSALWRARKEVLGLYGVKCKHCGTPQYSSPSTVAVGGGVPVRVCVVCQAKDQFEDYRFADKRASIVSYTHDALAASLDPPSTSAVVDFEGGGRGFFDMTDRDPERVQVNMPVEMTFRRLYSDRGINNYYWKITPLRCQSGGQNG